MRSRSGAVFTTAPAWRPAWGSGRLSVAGTMAVAVASEPGAGVVASEGDPRPMAAARAGASVVVPRPGEPADRLAARVNPGSHSPTDSRPGSYTMLTRLWTTVVPTGAHPAWHRSGVP